VKLVRRILISSARSAAIRARETGWRRDGGGLAHPCKTGPCCGIDVNDLEPLYPVEIEML
jgi:hypothetical protein